MDIWIVYDSLIFLNEIPTPITLIATPSHLLFAAFFSIIYTPSLLFPFTYLVIFKK